MKKSLLFAFLALLAAPFVAAAEETGDILLANLELDKLLNLGSALVAAALCIITYIAYTRTKNKRIAFVCAAFFLFAVKGALLSCELLLGDMAWTDVVASSLDFAILVTFFLGITRT